jgi:hypothetical protein
MADSFKELTKKLDKCRKIARHNIKKALVYIKNYESGNKEFFEEFIKREQKNYYSEDYLLRQIHNASLFLIEDSERVLAEVIGFAKILPEGRVSDYLEQYPFMVGVWMGDIYGDGGTEGLSRLIEDLEKTSKFFETDEVFFNFVRKKYLY